MMKSISIIPVNTEIRRCRLQTCHTAYSLIRIAVSGRIGIFGYTPDSLNAFILSHHLFYQIHVRTISKKGHIDHLNAKILCNCKMAVIARYGTEELYLVQLAPGSASHHAVSHRT